MAGHALEQPMSNSDQSTANDDSGSTPRPATNDSNDYSNEKVESALGPDQHPDNALYGEAYELGEESRQEAHRLGDDLQMLRIEREINSQEAGEMGGSKYSMRRTRSRVEEPEDAFNQPPPTQTFDNGPLNLQEQTNFAKAFFTIKKLPRIVRYFFYAVPVAALLSVPIILGHFTDGGADAAVGGEGGLQLMWFGIWLEIVWLSFWAARMIVMIFPAAMGFVGKAGGSSTSRKWKNIGRHLEIPLVLFFWMLAVLISFEPIVDGYRVPVPDGEDPTPELRWAQVVNKVIIAIFVLAVLHCIEKILIQWIASSFHRRTYSTRIEANKRSIAYLVHLYEFSKEQLFRAESIYGGDGASGTKTPMAALQKGARIAGNYVGDAVNRIKGDFTGEKVQSRHHPRKVVSELLRNSATSQVLARRLFRTFYSDKQDDAGNEVLVPEDLNPAFPTPEDAEDAFCIFDRDLNGDVSCEELEAMCDEVHREKKAIAASLKDLDDVIQKLDSVFLVIIVIITIIVFITIISSSAATALTSAGSTVLGLSWLLQATAQEFLQSIIFVFVKHPFDVGDRVTVYGNTGDTGAGDDYYVTAISLLYTEFKKMQGQIVQAPNSVLNTLFILNHRRSNGLADVNTLKMRFGTPQYMIDELKARMMEFCQSHKRDYSSQILTEMTTFEDSYAVSVNFIFFHKTSFQNESLRLSRHNRFATKLQEEMVNVGIEQPRRVYQISGRDFPVYNARVDPPPEDTSRPGPGRGGPIDTEPFPTTGSIKRGGSASGTQRRRNRAATGVSITVNDENNFDWQDVSSVRKTAPMPKAPPARMGSLGGSLHGARSTTSQERHREQHPGTIAEDSGEGSSLVPMQSSASYRQRRLFHSPRRASTLQAVSSIGRRPSKLGGDSIV